MKPKPEREASVRSSVGFEGSKLLRCEVDVR